MTSKRATADDVEGEPLVSERAPSVARAGQPTSGAAREQPNAFTELMRSKKPKLAATTADTATKKTLYFGRDGLAAYTADPASFSASRVLYFNDKFVVIRDLYPKATIHLLILPRDPDKSITRPQEAFDDPQFLEDCRREEKKVREIVADELKRRFGQHSASEQARLQAMEADELPDKLPPGRDWGKEVISGIHANPSMNHLHIHVLSRDMVSDPMKKRNHYLSFTTDFLVGLDQFPLASGDHRRDYKHFPEDMLCWRCGKNFQNKMAQLKVHLQEEFQQWIKE